MGGGSNDEQVAERTRGDRVARGAIARVEATLKADLDEDACTLDLVEHVDDRCEVERDRLLAERGQPGRGGKPQQRRVPRRRGRDHERVDTGLDDRRGRLHCAHAELGREPAGARSVRIGERERGDGLESLQRVDVDDADPADADDAYMETPSGRKVEPGSNRLFSIPLARRRS